jgi:hypothetical protein
MRALTAGSLRMLSGMFGPQRLLLREDRTRRRTKRGMKPNQLSWRMQSCGSVEPTGGTCFLISEPVFLYAEPNPGVLGPEVAKDERVHPKWHQAYATASSLTA